MSFIKNKKYLALSIITVLFFCVFLSPYIVQARLIDCSLSTTTKIVNEPNATPVVGGACDFIDLIATIDRIIDWIIRMAVVIFAISAIYGGFLYITSGTNPGNKDKAKRILWSTLTGFVIILVAWLIVFTIMNTLVNTETGSKNLFKFIGGSRT